MASIKDIAARHKVELNLPPLPSSNLEPVKPQGRLRRAWLTDTEKDEEGEISKPENKSFSQKNAEENFNRVQLGFNKGSIGVQLESNKGLNRVQTRFNEGSDRVQKEFNNGSNRVQLGFNKGSIGVQENNGGKVDFKPFISSENSRKLIEQLNGNEKKIFLFIIHICSIKSSISTGYMQGKEINSAIKISKNSRETSIKRLIKKGLITREKGKRGVNGTLNLTVPEFIKTEALKLLGELNSEKKYSSLEWSYNEQLGFNNSSNGVQLGFNSSSSSSSSLETNKTTTTGELEKIPGLSSEWLEMDIAPLSEIGFTQTHLEQIIRQGKLEPDVVQQSIWAFAFDLRRNDKAKTLKGDPLNFFMGILRKGNPYTPPANYESPQEEAMRVYLERQTELHEKKKQVEEGIFKLHFETWMDELTESQISEILPPNALGMCKPGSPARRGILFEHYKEKIWSEKKQAILKNIVEEISKS